MKLETGTLSPEQIEHKRKAGVKILAEMDKEEKEAGEKWESFNVLIKNSAKFAGEMDQHLDAYRKNANEEQRLAIGMYENLISQIKEAIKTFLRDISTAEKRSAGALVVIETDLRLVSDLCSQVYAMDNTFPSFEFIDRERYKKAIEEATREDFHHHDRNDMENYSLGRFEIVGIPYTEKIGADGEYYIFDQQAQKLSTGRIEAVRNVKDTTAIVSTRSRGFSTDSKLRLFMAESGKFSQDFQYLAPLIGKLYVGKEKGGHETVIIDKDAKILHEITDYALNAKKTKAVVRINFGYNILLEDGNLMFEDSAGFDIEEAVSYSMHSSWQNGREISKDIILKPRRGEEKFIRMDKNLEIVAEGRSREDVLRSKAA